MRAVIDFAKFSDTVGQQRLTEVKECFFEGFDNAMQSLNSIGERLPITYEKRTKWGLVHDVIIALLKNKYGSEGKIVEVNKWNGVSAIMFENVAFCRIKKFIGHTARVSVTLTPQQKRFNAQYLIDGIPNDPTLITIGYHVNKAETAILSVSASCTNADGLLWFQKIGGEGFSQLPIFDNPTTPVIPMNPSKEVKTKRVKPKRDPRKDTGTDTE